jgi:hypothetical protein
MRTITVTVHPFADIDLSDTERAQLTTGLEQRFAVVPGVEVRSKMGSLISASGSKSPISTGQLHAVFGDEVQERIPWNVHLLVADRSDNPSFFGVMFDANLSSPYSEGCAVFLGRIRSEGAPMDLLSLVAAHEVGHALNLCHCDASASDHLMTGDPNDWQNFSAATMHFSPLPRNIWQAMISERSSR